MHFAHVTLPTQHVEETCAFLRKTLGLEWLQSATRLDPSHVRAWVNLGLALYSLRRYEEAVPAYQAALAINTTPTIGWFTSWAIEADSSPAVAMRFIWAS